MSVRDGAGMQADGHKPGEVRHVHHEIRAYFVGDVAKSGEVEVPGVGRPACNDQFRPVLAGGTCYVGEVDPMVGFGDSIGRDVIKLAGEVQSHPVCQVTAVRQR